MNLLRQRLFDPLQLKSARFGPDHADKSENVVWGHEPRSLGRTKAIKPDPAEHGDPPFCSPGGFLYCSVADLLRYVDFHIQGANGNNRLLKLRLLGNCHRQMTVRRTTISLHLRALKNYPVAPKTLGEFLRQKRVDLGLSQRKLAEMLAIGVFF